MTCVNKRKPPEHPLLRRARALSQKHGVPMYLGLAAARREDPQSYRHFQQQGIAASQPKPIKKAAPDADVVAWDAAVSTWATNYGMSRCDAMTEIRKQRSRFVGAISEMDEMSFARRFSLPPRKGAGTRGQCPPKPDGAAIRSPKQQIAAHDGRPPLRPGVRPSSGRVRHGPRRSVVLFSADRRGRSLKDSL